MKKEVYRKSFHILFGIFFLLIIYFLGTEISLQIISAIFIIGLIVALLHRRGIKIPLFEKIIFFVEREHEKHFPGKAALMFFLAAIILLHFFRGEPQLVLAGLSVQIFADSAAALVGKAIGQHKIFSRDHYTKTIEGTLACFVVASIILLFFVPFEIALVVAIVATIIEFAPINDNLVIPLAVAGALKLLL
ncbi:MAG: phosphatidate cytidylyltransferase [Candidatus Diapherotrites archaeon]|uniref:Phosphatidate cytidylyltransferase n=1 Tax=Candidatus Iainarchaeum sp. TaxID=3101447 RepID=A0A8T5GE78_9ARCH|nr:phosphatidate cytidylyltransferase [Candidatus Diapherotrites archaeon]